MRSSPNLSYIIVTRNRLPHLRESLGRLLKGRHPDEEVIVVDGASTDGTVAYVRELQEKGEVDQFISEPDCGPGHAINRGFLAARGVLVKHMNDDDEYYFDELRKCKDFMLAHPDIDVINSNGINQFGHEYRREEDFMIRKNSSYHPFMMADQGMIIRRSSLALIGLMDTSFLFFDGEFTVRLTAGKARMAWYTGITWRHFFHEDSVSVTKAEVWRREAVRLARMYPIYSKWKHHVPKPVRDLIRFFIPKKQIISGGKIAEPTFLS